MRIAALLMAVLGATPAAAAECGWGELKGWSPATFQDRVAYLRRSYICRGAARGNYQLVVTARAGATEEQVGKSKGSIEPRGRWDRTGRIDERIFPNAYCGLPPPANPPLRFAEVNDDWQRVYPVTVRFTITGTGDMQALSGSSEVEALCPLCRWEGESQFAIMEDRSMASTIVAGVRYHASLARPLYECVKPSATLDVRYFIADTDEELRNAVQPQYVERGLERAFKITAQRAELDLPVPVAELCKLGKRRLAWELAGKGELARLAGGGRSFHDLKCRR